MPTKEELEQENADLQAQLEQAQQAQQAPTVPFDLQAQARALQELAAKHVAEAGALPAERLDEAREGHHYLVNGQKVDANGQPIKGGRD